MSSTLAHVQVCDHPLVQQLLTKMRDYQTPSGEFRRRAKQISRYLVYEAMRNLNVRSAGVETPLGPAKGCVLSDYIVLAPILRAGLIIAEAAQDLIPDARIYHIGLKRDEETLQAISYYAKLPDTLPLDSKIFILDPMLATGGSALAAIDLFAKLNVNNIQLISIVSAPEGIKKIHSKAPHIKITTAAVDDCLNEFAYIVPGLGDAGDRIFGT